MANRTNLFINSASILAAATRQSIGTTEYLVVPVIAAKVGVMNGLFYTAEGLKDYADAWNGVPVPVTHPKNGNEFLSANSPEGCVANIGAFYNVTFDEPNEALKGDLFLDIVRANALGYGTLLEELEAGKQVDVSTGLYPNVEDGGGDWNGEFYSGRVVGMIPDHLAILPNETGACSVKKGCGTHIKTNCEDKPSCTCKGKKDKKPSMFANIWKAVFGIKANEASYSEIESKIRSTLRSTISNDFWPYILDVYDNSFVYELDSTLYRQGYALDATEAVSLIGDPVRVIIKREYVPVEPLTNTENMKPPYIVATLAAMLAANQINAEEKKAIEALSDDTLGKIFPDPAKPIAANAAVTPPSVVPAVSALSPEDRALLDSLRTNQAAAKKKLAEDVLKAFPSMSPEILANMDVTALNAMASTIPGYGSNVTDFSGAAGGFGLTPNAAQGDDYEPPALLTREASQA